MSEYPHITYRRHTFLSALAMGLSAVVITFLISLTTVVIYGIHFAGERSERLVSLVEDAVRGLPHIQESLPPVLADIFDDRRQPDYCAQLEVSAKTALLPEYHGRLRTEIEVTNKGREVVSLLSLRIVVRDSLGSILAESNQWAATPFAAEHDWRGPLMPGSSRHFAFSSSGVCSGSAVDDLTTEVEITDVRIWNGREELPPIDSKVDPTSEDRRFRPNMSVEKLMLNYFPPYFSTSA
ncbi:MAG: hypothetical protein ACYTEK_11270 [Planctomycetota bacterium]|jgi:hypothetical protein